MCPSGCVLLTLFFCVTAVCQVPSSHCDTINSPVAACTFLTRADNRSTDKSHAPLGAFAYGTLLAGNSGSAAADVPYNSGSLFVSAPGKRRKLGFHWGQALFESFTLLSIEQAYVLHDDWRWVAGNLSENGIPFNHYWRDYKQSLSTWVHSGWNDGDPNMYGYVGHPIQGVAASYIYIQNDPKSEKLEFSKTKAYWRSRLKATLWNALYSTQWNIGPLSEMTVEKYGTHSRSPWNKNGSWPCTTKHCYTGVGQIDLVMTPVAGFGWLVGEDFLDKFITRRVEGATRNRSLIDITRCTLDPIRAGTNILHAKRPWYRASRDSGEAYFTNQHKELEPPIRGGSAVGESH
jgi:hypothetical protein